jgi:photosystem II stability/assembly factor-like uncharacterized protein
MFLRCILCLAGASLFCLTAGAASWLPRSPEGANVRAFATAGHRLLLGTSTGLHVSGNDGASWTRLSSLPAWTNVRAITVDPHDSSHWYVQYDQLLLPDGDSFLMVDDIRQRMLETRDGGQTWTTPPLPGELWQAPYFHPLNRTSLLGFYEDPVLQRHVWSLSQDGGRSWTAGPDYQGSWQVIGLDLSPSHFGAALRANTHATRIDFLVSDNAGLGWGAAVASVPISSYLDRFLLFPRSGNARQALWLHHDYGTGGGGDMVSRSGSVDFATGEVVNFPVSAPIIKSLIDDPLQPGTVLAHVMSGAYNRPCDYCARHSVWSLAPGATAWQPRGGDIAGSFRYQMPDGLLRAGAGAKLYLLEKSVGVHRSDDGGATWSVQNTGLREAPVNAVSVDPRTPRRLLAGREMQSLQRSEDSGRSWRDVSGQVPSDVRALARSPLDPDHVLAVADDGLYRSRDGGAGWHKVLTPLSGTPGQIGWNSIGWCANNDTDIMASVGTSVYRSADAGLNWSLVQDFGSVMRIASAQRNPATVYLQSAYGLWRTSDCGVALASIPGSRFYSVAVDPNDSRHLIVAGWLSPSPGTHLAVSHDAGATWTAADNPGVFNLDSTGWIDACDPQRYTHPSLRTWRAGTPGFKVEPPGYHLAFPNARAADSQCVDGRSFTLVAINDGVWLAQEPGEQVFAESFE